MRALVKAILPALAALSILACSIGTIQGPKYVPESTVLVGPEPKIPPEFFGCWKGTFTHFDTVTPLSPQVSTSSIKAFTTSYEFCFSKRPDGTGELHLTDVEIGGQHAKVLKFDNRVVSVEPEFYRAWLKNHVTSEAINYLLYFIPVYYTLDIYAEEQLQMLSPDVIRVKGNQIVVIGGNMLASMTFHTNFNRVKDLWSSS